MTSKEKKFYRSYNMIAEFVLGLFNRKNNTLDRIEFYREDDTLEKIHFFREDGKTLKQTQLYRENGTLETIELYREDGTPKQVEFFRNDGRTLEKIEFDKEDDKFLGTTYRKNEANINSMTPSEEAGKLPNALEESTPD